MLSIKLIAHDTFFKKMLNH